MREIYCAKLKKKAIGLDFVPYPNELGQKIYETISAEAWEQWLAYQTMLINEGQLDLQDDIAHAQLQEMMQAFLFPNS
jgi:Fe-S cluster biosynthesis and repair protein YggX